jgi:DNA-binding NarL/FixJ family response regulator
MSTRIFIADNDTFFREGLRFHIKNCLDMEVIGEAGDRKTTLTMVSQLTPDVVIINVNMPDQNGIDTIRHIIKNPHIKVIVFLVHPDKQIIKDIFKAGASGYLLKNCRSEDVEHAIRSVIESKISLSPKKIDNYMNILYGTSNNA